MVKFVATLINNLVNNIVRQCLEFNIGNCGVTAGAL
jgi:hypothetical protein